MIFSSRVLGLPASALLLVSTLPWPTISAELEWPYNLPAGMKYYPEDESLVKRGLNAHEQLASRTPTGMRKMSGDPSEMFFLDYWQFDNPRPGEDLRLSRRSIPSLEANQSSEDGILPAFRLHSLEDQSPSQSPLHIFRRTSLETRDFNCPANTNSCASISRPDSCCAAGEYCVKVTDTGSGDVGCCPQGASCGNQIGGCDTSAGYKSCPSSSNGGCCIPNFDCLGVGCISVSTTTTTTTLGAVTASGRPLPTCTSGYQSCPVSLGGGCCPTSFQCASSTSCLSTSTITAQSTAPALVPFRPTGTTDTEDTAALPTILTTGTQLIAICPTNFYFCSAYYRPGCCRIGRDCAMTNCPAATASSTLVSNGVTVVVPVGGSTGGGTYVTTALLTGTVATGGHCAGGWSSCGQNVGGGCCPPSFSCGTSCTASGSGGTSVVGKVAPSGVDSRRAGMIGWIGMAIGSLIGVLMVVL